LEFGGTGREGGGQLGGFGGADAGGSSALQPVAGQPGGTCTPQLQRSLSPLYTRYMSALYPPYLGIGRISGGNAAPIQRISGGKNRNARKTRMEERPTDNGPPSMSSGRPSGAAHPALGTHGARNVRSGKDPPAVPVETFSSPENKGVTFCLVNRSR
jgi:hypothetical protein